ncbi:MAG: hypothetical protein IH592_02725, partial [Bacteroidales bacterium]|nr:hypothetical protein [Bacteroidales bacterium]
MKKIMLFLLPALMLVSCEKNYLVPADEVPSWLKNRIAETEKELQSNPKSGLDMGAWIRYSYEGDYYFEWLSPISSSFPPIHSYDGELMTYFTSLYQKYVK